MKIMFRSSSVAVMKHEFFRWMCAALQGNYERRREEWRQRVKHLYHTYKADTHVSD